MKICAAQMEPLRGNVNDNIGRHVRLIVTALSHGVNLIVFPELSLTGYEPTLSRELAIQADDKRLDVFQLISDTENISICTGMPVWCPSGVQISMIVFQPGLPRSTYSKRYLHEDELPYFVHGAEPLILEIGQDKIAPAICYESLKPEHAEEAFRAGAAMYLVSVAKSAKGIAKAYPHYAGISRKYHMPVIMSNCIGSCDDFESAGKSAIWNKKGQLMGTLNNSNEGLLIFDTETEEIIQWSGLNRNT